jgi:hypothetical protein
MDRKQQSWRCPFEQTRGDPMHPWPVLAFLIAATAATGLLAGASLDQSVKQLPARHRIGAAAFSRYSQAADLGNGIALYATLGIGSALLNVGAALAAVLEGLPLAASMPIHAGAALAILHSIVTARAAPVNFSQKGVSDEAKLAAIFARFSRLQSLRAGLQLINFGINLAALGLMAAG